MSDIIKKAKVAREASYALAKLPGAVRDGELGKVAEEIWRQREAILEANARDLEAAEEMLQRGEITGAMIKRLELNPEKIRGILDLHPGDFVVFEVMKDQKVYIHKASPVDLEFAKALEGTLSSEWLSENDEEAYGDL